MPPVFHSSLTSDRLGAILTALDSRFVAQFANGAIRLLGRSLPGEAVCAILPDQGDGVLRMVYDPNKPNAACHTGAMLREWWESYRVPVAFPDGSVELLPQSCPSPRREQTVLYAD